MRAQPQAPPQDRLGGWCGGWLIFAMVMAPPMAWLGPLGFAPLVAIVGLACLPALRITDDDRPAYLALLVGMIWAIGSTVWSPYHHKLLGSTALKLPLEAALYFAAVCAARRASPRTRTWMLRIFAWGMALLGLLLLAEGLTGAAVYRALRIATHDPIRPDLAIKNVAVATFVLALFWPTAALAAVRSGAGWWLAVPMAVGLGLAAHRFGSDAPFAALFIAIGVGLAVWRWPVVAPRALAAGAGLFFLAAPAIVWAARASGVYGRLESTVQLSWAERMGYWRHAADWIGDHPLRGWGLDASRMFAPGIQLHPHDAALQAWLELGLIGAVAAAVFWAVTLARLARPVRDAGAAAAAASAMVYLLFSLVSFGAWQEWWLALGGFAAMAATAVMLAPQPATGPARAPKMREASTAAPISK
jgi:O-antigen ligase